MYSKIQSSVSTYSFFTIISNQILGWIPFEIDQAVKFNGFVSVQSESLGVIDEDVVTLGSAKAKVFLIMRPLQEGPRMDGRMTLRRGRERLLELSSEDVPDSEGVSGIRSLIRTIGDQVTKQKKINKLNKNYYIRCE